MGESPIKLAWGHININVSNLERSVAFYELLGFTPFLPAIPYLGINSASEEALPGELRAALNLGPQVRGRGCILQLDGGFPMLDLTELSGVGSASPLANSDLGLVRICLASQNLAEDVPRLRENGVEFVSEPRRAPGGLADVALCRDPDGTLIELLQVYLERWAPYLAGGE